MKRKLLILISFCFFLVISCGNKEEQKIRKDFDATMGIMRTGDYNKVKKMSSELSEEEFSIVEEGFKRIKYKIKKVEVNGNRAKMAIEVNYPDISSVMQEYLVQLASKGQEIENKKLTIDQGKKEMRNFTKSFFSQKFKENKVNFVNEIILTGGKMSDYILEMKNIRKEFLGGKIVANDDITLKVKKGEIHAIVGENGAGKSTLMKILNGLYAPTSGEIFYKGKKTEIISPTMAAKLGIGMVYQHFMLVDTLTVAENMVLGFEPKKGGIFFDLNKAREKVREVSEKYGLNIDPDAKVSDLSVGIQQRIEILKVLFKGAELLVFDEPSAVLTPQEVKELYEIMRNLVKEGKTIIFISHKLQEVLDLSDNITVIRRGSDVGRLATSEATKEKIANLMVGRVVLFEVKRPEVKLGNVLVKVEHLTVKDKKGGKDGIEKVSDVSFEIREGEVLGIAGVQGNGQTELIEALAGLVKIDDGKYSIGNKSLENQTPKEIKNSGFAHIPEDRHKRAAIDNFTMEENMALGLQDEYSKGFLMNYGEIEAKTKKYIEKYDIRPNNGKIKFGGLSGGNQQKVVVARELERENKFIIAAQPTRGVDIGAIEMIHNTILQEKTKKKAILVVSAELSEIMALSDRIAVMYSGKIVGILNRSEATAEKIGILMAGGKLNDEK